MTKNDLEDEQIYLNHPANTVFLATGIMAGMQSLPHAAISLIMGAAIIAAGKKDMNPRILLQDFLF